MFHFPGGTLEVKIFCTDHSAMKRCCFLEGSHQHPHQRCHLNHEVSPQGSCMGLGRTWREATGEDTTLQCWTWRSASWYFVLFLFFFLMVNVYFLAYGRNGAPLSFGEKKTTSFPVSLGSLTGVGAGENRSAIYLVLPYSHCPVITGCLPGGGREVI